MRVRNKALLTNDHKVGASKDRAAMVGAGVGLRKAHTGLRCVHKMASSIHPADTAV